MSLVSFNLANGGEITVHAIEGHRPTYALLESREPQSVPQILELKDTDVLMLHSVLGAWLKKYRPADNKHYQEFMRGNLSYLLEDMKEKDIPLKHVHEVAELIKEYR